jgi:hypothetical protein
MDLGERANFGLSLGVDLLQDASTPMGMNRRYKEQTLHLVYFIYRLL